MIPFDNGKHSLLRRSTNYLRAQLSQTASAGIIREDPDPRSKAGIPVESGPCSIDILPQLVPLKKT